MGVEVLKAWLWVGVSQQALWERRTLGRLEERHSNLGTTDAGWINGQHVRSEGDTDMLKASSGMVRVLLAHGWETLSLAPTPRSAYAGPSSTKDSLQSSQETAHLLLSSQCPECHYLDTPPLVLSVTTELV